MQHGHRLTIHVWYKYLRCSHEVLVLIFCCFLTPTISPMKLPNKKYKSVNFSANIGPWNATSVISASVSSDTSSGEQTSAGAKVRAVFAWAMTWDLEQQACYLISALSCSHVSNGSGVADVTGLLWRWQLEDMLHANSFSAALWLNLGDGEQFSISVKRP